jgi:small conductance mechanosensitive channel
MTHKFSYYVFNIRVALKEDIDRVVSVLQEVGREAMENKICKEGILEPLEILGLDSFADSAVIIKARVKTLPIKQWVVGREMNRLIKKRFDEKGIEIPVPHTSVYFGEASKPVSLKFDGYSVSREEIRAILREVLAEQEENKAKGEEERDYREGVKS